MQNIKKLKRYIPLYLMLIPGAVYLMINNYALILGLMDTLNDWNDKLNGFANDHMDNVAIGTVIVGVLIVIAFWGVQTLNK